MRCLEWEICAGGAALALVVGVVFLAVSKSRVGVLEAPVSAGSLESMETNDNGRPTWQILPSQRVGFGADGSCGGIVGQSKDAVIPPRVLEEEKLKRVWMFMDEYDGMPFMPRQSERGAFRWEYDQELYNAGAEPDGKSWWRRIETHGRKDILRVRRGGKEVAVPLDEVLEASERQEAMLFLKVDDGEEKGYIRLKLLWLAGLEAPLPAGMVLRIECPAENTTLIEGDGCFTEYTADGCSVKKIVMEPEQLEALMLNVTMKTEADNYSDVMKGIAANARMVNEDGACLQREAHVCRTMKE